MVIPWLKEKSILQQFTERAQERPGVRIRMDLSVSDLLSLGSPSRSASPWSEGAVAPGPFPQPRGPPVSVSWPFCLAFVSTAALSEAFGAKPSGGVLGVRCLASLSPRALRALCSAPLSEAGCPGALF